MKILFIVSEVEPFAKTGGLADVASALPKALAQLGHDVRIITPLYRAVNREAFSLRPDDHTLSIPAGPRTHAVRLWHAPSPASGAVLGRVLVSFLECGPLFDRDGLYQNQGTDHPDNLERFGVFSQAALQAARALGWRPDVVHAHDWQAALACAHLAHGEIGRDPFFAGAGTVLTVHNLAYQGLFPKAQWPVTGLPEALCRAEGLEFYGRINCLKGGLVTARRLTTVSPSYAKEIQTAEFGCGLEGVLQARRAELDGILNGIDPEEWNPETDPHLARTYSAQHPAGKSLCKLALQQQQGLPERCDLLIGMVQRLVEQKGIDIVLDAMERLMALPLQLAILGTGEARYHARLQRAAERFPDRLTVSLAFDDALAHRIEAGADALLMPSRFEPCGLNQMYSMRYGTVPIVKRVGGLADTVVDVTPETLGGKTATGFVFSAHTASALLAAVERALAAFRDQALWGRLMRAGMSQDFSWGRSAQAYAEVYRRVLEEGAGGRRRVRG